MSAEANTLCDHFGILVLTCPWVIAFRTFDHWALMTDGDGRVSDDVLELNEVPVLESPEGGSLVICSV